MDVHVYVQILGTRAEETLPMNSQTRERGAPAWI